MPLRRPPGVVDGGLRDVDGREVARRSMIRGALATLALVAWLLPPPVRAATDYTDTWWAAAGGESGWGINLTQQGNFIYGTFYVYGQDRKATWFTAQMTRDGTAERFTGGLYRVTGTWYAAPVWQGYEIAQAGTATFTPGSAYAGTLEYSVDGTTITKSIERITLVRLNVAGSYSGAAAGTRTGCNPSGKFTDFVDFEIQHSATTGDFRLEQYSGATGRLVCRMEGKAVQFGKLLLVDSAAYSCPDTGWNQPARIYNLRPTPTGFEAQWVSDTGSGCTESGDLSGVTFR